MFYHIVYIFFIYLCSIKQNKRHLIETMDFLQNFNAFAMKSNVIGAITGEERQRT